MVLLACASLGIPVVLEAPRLSEIATWDAAFLTSAVRIIVPIERVLWRAPGDDPNSTPRSHTLDTTTSEQRVLQPLRSKICDLWRSC
jgi:branched-subunit amino acid aminotransferase/4-amino-4-deoxychorismate lyase